ncbi:MAG TPA: cytochrome c [Methylomirabilota bacterium]|nr:cytochrome c [Methylomirabilota bacterium]
MKKLIFCLTLASIISSQPGCRHPRRGEPIVGPLPVNDPAVARGRIVYAQHCHQCHPGGEGGLGPGLNDKPLPKFLIKTQVRLGLGTMPGFPEERIDSESLDDLVNYIVALRHHSKPLPGRLEGHK